MTQMPSWLMAILGIGIVALILTYFPIVDYLMSFLMMVVLPVVFIASLLMGGMGLYNATKDHLNGLQEAINRAVQARVREMRAA